MGGLTLSHFVIEPIDFPVVTNALVVVWLLVIGGSIGSFLNVLVYRLPAGLSIVRPRSFCPHCKTPILARDNLPVVGWLLLRGRCRVCRAAISPRYPLVEFAAAIVFTGLMFGEPLTGGAILPIPLAAAESYPLFGMAVYHFALICGLATAALMNHDDAVVPVSYWRWMLVVGLISGVAWPLLRPVASGWTAADSLAAGLVDGAFGAVVGAVLGMSAWPAAAIGSRGRAGHLDSAAAGATVGLFLGAQAAAGIATATALVFFLLRAGQGVGLRPRVSWPAAGAAVTLVWLCGWRLIVERARLADVYLFGENAPWWMYVAAVVAVFAITLAGRNIVANSASRATDETPIKHG